MSGCTAPTRGHHTASGAAACPVHGGRGSYSRQSYYSPPSYEPRYPPRASVGSSESSGRVRPKWSPSNSSVTYTPQQVQALAPVRRQIEERAQAYPDLRDAFLCHAWDDRQGIAKDLCDLLVARNVSVWFSENDIGLGEPFLRAIDKGLAKSRIGIVLVTPALLKRLPAAGVADKELSVLLARDQLVPILHNTTYEALREVSPMLASRTGLSTGENQMADVATKLAELVAL